MPTTSTVIGTIDLTAFCGCGAPCPACCGCGSCGALPNTINLTVTAHGTDCVCAAGASSPLTWDGVSAWKGSMNFFALGCADPLAGNGLLTLSITCSGGLLMLTIDNDPVSGGCCASCPSTYGPSSTVCSPLSVVYPSHSITDCCNGQHGPTVVFTLTL